MSVNFIHRPGSASYKQMPFQIGNNISLNFIKLSIDPGQFIDPMITGNKSRLFYIIKGEGALKLLDQNDDATEVYRIVQNSFFDISANSKFTVENVNRKKALKAIVLTLDDPN